MMENPHLTASRLWKSGSWRGAIPANDADRSGLLLSEPELFSSIPIFQGLAISLMAGEVASLLLSRMTVPILYYLSARTTTPARRR